MICHHYKCVFVHIPKTAGQSIEHVFLDLLDLTWETRAPLLLRSNDRPELGPPRLAHLKADEYVRHKYLTLEMFDNYFKFAFVRNPWSRVVSIYKYLEFSKECDFKTFLTGVFRNTIFNDTHWFVGLQSNFVYSDNGDLLVDFVGKFENLQNEFNHVCERISIPATKVPRINESKEDDYIFSLDAKRPANDDLRNTSSRRTAVADCNRYKAYYDRESIDLVAELYRRDIELFQYDFG